jgi:deoxyribonuclease V
MKIRRLHPWDVSCHEAIKIQETLHHKLVFASLSDKIRHVAGIDVSCSKKSDTMWAGVVVLRYPSLEKVEERWAKGITFPIFRAF